MPESSRHWQYPTIPSDAHSECLHFEAHPPLSPAPRSTYCSAPGELLDWSPQYAVLPHVGGYMPNIPPPRPITFYLRISLCLVYNALGIGSDTRQFTNTNTLISQSRCHGGLVYSDFVVVLVHHAFTDFLVSKTDGSSLLRMIPKPTLETS